MKKILIIVCVILGLGIISFFELTYTNGQGTKGKPIYGNYKTIIDPKEKLYNDVLVSLLFPHTQKAVNNFYSKFLKEIPGADPNMDRLLSVDRIGEENRLEYLIKIETMPYIGPHNSVGRDHITFRINAIGEVSLEKFEHIESFSSFPKIYPNLIKQWPPH